MTNADMSGGQKTEINSIAKSSTSSYALFVTKNLLWQGIKKGFIAVVIAIINQGRCVMDKEYLLTMAIFKKFLNDKLITNEEFEEINKQMIEKYTPVLSILV